MRLFLVLIIAGLATAQAAPLVNPYVFGSAPANGLLANGMAYYQADEVSGTMIDALAAFDLTEVNANIGQDVTNFKLVSARVLANTTTSNRMRSADSASFNKSAAFSITGWVRPTTADATTRTIFGQYNSATSNRGYRASMSTSGGFRFTVSPLGTSSGEVTVSSGVFPVANTWYFVACGWDGTNAWISMDASSKVTSAVAAPFASAARFTIFNDDSGAGAPVQGQIDEVYVVDRTWGDAEIDTLYGAGTPPAFSTFD